MINFNQNPMEQLTINTKEQDVRLLFNSPELIQKIYFEPSSEKVWAKHYFSSIPILVGLIPKDFVNLFSKNLIVIKSWKLIPDNNKIVLKITLNGQ
jgi:hypothetical protein